MNDEDIAKLASKLTESLATKEDFRRLEIRVDKVDKNLGTKIDEVDKKADVILSYVDGVDEMVNDHEKRLKKIENIPSIAHDLK